MAFDFTILVSLLLIILGTNKRTNTVQALFFVVQLEKGADSEAGEHTDDEGLEDGVPLPGAVGNLLSAEQRPVPFPEICGPFFLPSAWKPQDCVHRYPL